MRIYLSAQSVQIQRPRIRKNLLLDCHGRVLRLAFYFLLNNQDFRLSNELKVQKVLERPHSSETAEEVQGLRPNDVSGPSVCP